MQAIRNKNSEIERILAKELWQKGYRYRKNDKTVFGKPDLTFKGLKIAIFADSEYFHGKDWEKKKNSIKTNTIFWQKKIEQNVLRDKIVTETLLKNNWEVLRFWGDDIKKNLDFCVAQIITTIEKRKNDKVHGNKEKVRDSGRKSGR